MDFSILIFIALFVVACFSLFVVYKFGIKEKSYEEALAEQRQQASSLLGIKFKPKEKKNKKSNKKSKEKLLQDSETNDSESVENKENAQPTKLHVEFKEEAEEVPITEELKLPLIKETNKQRKVKKVRPILVKKEQSPQRPTLDVSEAPIANHFEENPPKDDLELLRSNSRDDIFRQDPVKEKVTKEKKSNVEASVTAKNKKNVKPVPPADVNKLEKPLPPIEETKVEEKVVIDVIPVVPQTNGIVVGNTGKEKKKKKSEFNTKQLSAEQDGLINSVRKAELSKTEIQLLIDLLLNKQLEAPAVIDEWSEGKSDPIQKLKKQLAEKEKALEDEQQALAGAQAKLREIRSEQQTEKSQWQQKIRGLDEIVQSRLIEIQAANNRYQVDAQKIQQLQADLNAETVKTSKVMEENAALQIQAQEFEATVPQMQDAKNLIIKLTSDLDEVSSSNRQLQQVAVDFEHQNKHLDMQMANMEKEYKDTILDLQAKLEYALVQESNWKGEISNLNAELQKQFEEQRNMQDTMDQLNDQLHITNNEKAESAKLITQLKSDLQQTKDELAGLRDLPESNNKHEVEILNLSNKLSSTRNELSSKLEELQQTEKKYNTELETSHKKYLMVQKELEEQKSKNNELRTKNWKVMEALNAAESKSKLDINDKQPEIDVKKLSTDLINKEQESHKQFMQRLFPEIEDLKTTDANNWQDEYTKHIKVYINTLKQEQMQSSRPSTPQESSKVAKLESEIERYKTIIDDTETTFNNLQKHVEQEEIKLRNQLAAKETELEQLKDSRLSQLQTKLADVETQLSKEVEAKRKLLEECQLLKNEKSQHSTQIDSTATIERLSEEVNRLREQLEQTKNGDIGVCLKTQNCNNSINGPAFLEVPSIRNSNICSNMGCQFLYCDGNSCGNNL